MLYADPIKDKAGIVHPPHSSGPSLLQLWLPIRSWNYLQLLKGPVQSVKLPTTARILSQWLSGNPRCFSSAACPHSQRHLKRTQTRVLNPEKFISRWFPQSNQQELRPPGKAKTFRIVHFQLSPLQKEQPTEGKRNAVTQNNPQGIVEPPSGEETTRNRHRKQHEKDWRIAQQLNPTQKDHTWTQEPSGGKGRSPSGVWKSYKINAKRSGWASGTVKCR